MRIRIVLLLLLWTLSSGTPCFASDLVLVGGKIYPSPTAPPIEDGTVVVRDSRIYYVGPSATIKLRGEATLLNCQGLVITAGFWNSHVHILTQDLLHAEKLPADLLSSQLEQMLTRWGFTTVFDVASVLDNTNTIRRRIESGEVRGPRILTVVQGLEAASWRRPPARPVLAPGPLSGQSFFASRWVEPKTTKRPLPQVLLETNRLLRRPSA